MGLTTTALHTANQLATTASNITRLAAFLFAVRAALSVRSLDSQRSDGAARVMLAAGRSMSRVSSADGYVALPLYWGGAPLGAGGGSLFPPCLAAVLPCPSANLQPLCRAAAALPRSNALTLDAIPALGIAAPATLSRAFGASALRPPRRNPLQRFPTLSGRPLCVRPDYATGAERTNYYRSDIRCNNKYRNRKTKKRRGDNDRFNHPR